MDFLVKMVTVLPPDLDPVKRSALLDAEKNRAAELADHGALIRLWRIPGTMANWGIWRGVDATAVHAAVASLPLWPWMRVTVHPLADHPNDPGA